MAVDVDRLDVLDWDELLAPPTEAELKAFRGTTGTPGPDKVSEEINAWDLFAFNDLDEVIAASDAPFVIGPDGTIMLQSDLEGFVQQGVLNGIDWITFGPSEKALASDYLASALDNPKPPMTAPAATDVHNTNDIGPITQRTRPTKDTSFRETTDVENRQAANKVIDLLGAGRGDEVTEQDFARAMRVRDYFLEQYDLPMDQASRMARADEHWPQTGTHFTRADVDFDYPRTDLDGGFHYGSPEAAFDRAALTQGVPPVYTTNTPYGVMEGPGGLSANNAALNARQKLIAEGKDPADYEMDSVTGEVRNSNSEEITDWVWLGKDPRNSVLRGYTMLSDKAPEVGPRTMAVRLANWNPYVSDADAGHWHPLGTAASLERQDPVLANELRQAANFAKTYPEQLVYDTLGQPIDAALGRASATDMEMRAMQKVFTERGHTGVEYPNRYEGTPTERSNFVFAPQQIRSSLSALFDPRLRHLGHMGAGFAGAVPLAYGILPEEQ